jgi:hypothetical protein
MIKAIELNKEDMDEIMEHLPKGLKKKLIRNNQTIR